MFKNIDEVDAEIRRLKSLKRDWVLIQKIRKDDEKRLAKIHQAKLRQLREERGLSLSEVASELGVSKAVISYWECMKKPIPAERLKQYRKLLNY